MFWVNLPGNSDAHSSLKDTDLGKETDGKQVHKLTKVIADGGRKKISRCCNRMAEERALGNDPRNMPSTLTHLALALLPIPARAGSLVSSSKFVARGKAIRT